MPFRAVLDANVLVPVPLCDLLLRLAESELFDPVWSDRLLAEVRNALAMSLGVPAHKADARIAAMRRAFEDAAADPRAIDELEAAMGNEPKDRHVLAAAVAGAAQAIVTFDVRDFPSEVCAGYGVEAIHPDDFLVMQLDLDPSVVRATLIEQAADLRDPPMTPDEVLSLLQRSVPRFVEAFRARPLT